jgi:hypothetical protein
VKSAATRRRKVTRVDECICPVDLDGTEPHATRDKEFNQLFSTVPKGSRFHVGLRLLLFRGPRERISTAETHNVKRTSFEHVIDNFNAVLILGCTAQQTSADAEIDGRYNGALTYYLLKTLSMPNGLSVTLEQTLARTRVALQENGYAQRPQLEGSKGLMEEPFLTVLRRKAVAA